MCVTLLWLSENCDFVGHPTRVTKLPEMVATTQTPKRSQYLTNTDIQETDTDTYIDSYLIMVLVSTQYIDKPIFQSNPTVTNC